jgi:hypothetical protein
VIARRSRSRGYVLVTTLAALAVIAFVAARFAARIDQLREQSLTMKQYAAGQIEAESARAAALYWIGTRPLAERSVGWPGEPPLAADGRLYRLASGARVALQDQRGLVPMSSPDDAAVAALLRQHGVAATRTATFVDVLEDYLDLDDLKRLNGAEARDYAALGLAGPRNDWLITPAELRYMPAWRDDSAMLDKLMPLFSARHSVVFNPSTAPRAVLQAYLPGATVEQLERFEALRQAGDFGDGRRATALTGLPLDVEDFIFLVGTELRLTVWAPGLPRALEYNLTLTPGGARGPWLISEAHSVPRPSVTDGTQPTPAFPLALDAADRPAPTGAVEP